MAASPVFDDGLMSPPSSSIASPRPVRSRAQSMSSDKPSTISHGLVSPPTTISPPPAFIATSAASQIVTNDHDSHASRWYDQHGIEPAGETAEVSEAALQLVNNFLDQLLFNFLQVARSTTLRSLRPAVSEVLKPKLAKDAINNADEELREYLGGGDEEDYVQPQGGKPNSDWDHELVWKRTRLRCMVYSSLGDLEEEDEDYYMEQENLEIGVDEQISDVISPAVAIFLTSVMEYMGELTLTVAGQAAYHRMRTRFQNELKDGLRNPTDLADRIVVEDIDMERVALDRTLGRLWRGWKKRIRTPAIDLAARSYSRSSSRHGKHDSNVSDAVSPRPSTVQDVPEEARPAQDPVEETIIEDVQPADIPLPMSDGDIEEIELGVVPATVPLPMREKDVDEIEVPGLAPEFDDSEPDDEFEDAEESLGSVRPKSLFLGDKTTMTGLGIFGNEPSETTPDVTQERRRSLPTPPMSVFYSNLQRSGNHVAASLQESRPVQAETDDGVLPVAESRVPTVRTEKETKSQTSEVQGTKSHADAYATLVGPKEDQEIEHADNASDKKHLSKIITSDTATTYADAPEAAADDADEEGTTYEKAMIMTSARVSVLSGSSPSISESGKPFGPKRSSSVSSARLIDVAGPKSPSGSRSPSVDVTERARPVSISRASSASSPSVPDEPSRPAIVDSETRNTAVAPTSNSPVDRLRPALQNSTTISESEEEADVVTELAEKPADYTSYGGSHYVFSRGKNQPPSFNQNAWKPTARHDSLPSNKLSAVSSNDETNNMVNVEPTPEVPRKAPGRQSPRADGMGSVSIERTKTKESDEDPALPAQTSASPRQIHTSGSSTSSATGRLKAVRTSEDNGPNRAESVARNFEELIQSNQTITYTLTPENMRDIDSKHSLEGPVVTKVSSKNDEGVTRNRSPSSPTAPESKISAASRIIGPNSPVGRKFSIPDVRKNSVSAPKSPRMSISQARDARVPTESTADFAQFIKSTGPPGENRPPALRNVNAAPSSPTALEGFEFRRGSTATTATQRNRYQPRDAAVDNKADNSDLIDFIRQGPPSAATNPRIPRHVAPFRNTADSEVMSSAIGGKATDATIPEIRSSQTSTSVAGDSMPSMQSSINSNTALLKNKASMPNSKMFDDDDMMPKRKTRRVRDPYAIDFSDEEDEFDEEMLMTPKAPVKREESLAEFLSNYDPPPSAPVAAPQPQKLPKKKASAPSLMSMSSMGRFLRNQGKEFRSSGIPPSPTVPESRSLSSRAGTIGSNKGGFIPIQVNMPAGYDKYGSVDTGNVRPIQPARSGSTGRVPMKKFEPREAVSNTTRTADLAAFLRDSGPPDSGPIAQPMAQSDETPNFSKMFARRKKQTFA